MTGLVYVSVVKAGTDLVVLDAARRLYIGLSREGDYWHVISPALENMVNADGAVIRSAGQLTCRCRGGLYRGTCYRTVEAEAFEGTSGASAAALAWLREPDPAEAPA